ncbi:MAG: hypothetical protein IH623_19770 [Verrucomicrobia bacterium]|nr:hypothetical protein [Verrucomicrobiota bacterium]
MKHPKPEIPGTWPRSGFTCRNPHLNSRSGVSAERRHSGVRKCGALPSRRYDRDEIGGRLLLPLCLLISTLCFLLSAFAQFAIDWHTIDGGGGTSTGGVYSVTGTIGQPDAGAMSGGNYTLQGGFWGVTAAVQTPDAPLLSILHTTTNTVAVSWPSPSTGWTLQVNTNSASSVNWSNVTSGIQDSGTTKTLIVNPPAGSRFYRLFQP